jgi:hypothetical protein
LRERVSQKNRLNPRKMQKRIRAIPRNFPRIKERRGIGFAKRSKIVFCSISRRRREDPVKKVMIMRKKVMKLIPKSKTSFVEVS